MLTAYPVPPTQAEQPSEQQQQQQQPTAVPQSPEPAGAQVVQNGSGGDLQPHPHSSAQTPPSQAHLQPPSRQAGLTQQQQQQQLQEQMQMQQHQAQLQLQQLHQQAVVHAASSTALGGVPHVNPQLLGSLLPAPPNAGSQAPQQAGGSALPVEVGDEVIMCTLLVQVPPREPTHRKILSLCWWKGSKERNLMLL